MRVLPSVLSMDYSQMNHQLDLLESCGITMLHFDVMDGHFVPNLSFGADLLKGFRKRFKGELDVHLMVDDPLMFIDAFAKAGADWISFHLESYHFDERKINQCIDLIHDHGLKAGIVIRPTTVVDALFNYLDQVEMVLLMSVQPGFGGQAFMPETFERMDRLKAYIDQHDLSIEIEVDGGINASLIQPLVDHGMTMAVAGSAVFKGDIAANVAALTHGFH